MATAPRREQSDSRTPDFKAPPKSMQREAQERRAALKACHGNWYACAIAHPDH
jgi:hypothetical protein